MSSLFLALEPTGLETAADWSTVAVGVVAIVTLAIAAVSSLAGRRNKEREQASKVFVVPWHWRFGTYGAEPGAEQVWKGEAVVRVMNRSNGPVFSIEVNLLNWTWEEDRERLYGRVVGALQPRKKSKKIPFESIPEPPEDFKRILMLQPPIEIDFRDANGRRWRRSPNGELSPLDKIKKKWWSRAAD